MEAVMDKVLKGNPGVMVKLPDAEVAIPKSSQDSFLAMLQEDAKAQAEEMKKYWVAQPPQGLKNVTGKCPCGCGFTNEPLGDLDPKMLADRKQRSLDWVNALRTEWGHPALVELPKGRQGKGNDCVIARALPRRCSVGGAVQFEHGPSVMLPSPVAQFVNYFDRGAYPELVA